MNIFKRECKVNAKGFIIWNLGLFLLIYAGMAKYEGLSTAAGSVGVDQMLNQFPKVVLAMFGMSGLNIKTLEGYYGVMIFYSVICAVIYGIQLGANAVSRESVDRTYEFIFTKPCSKRHVLGMKVLSGSIALAGFALGNLLYTLLTFRLLNLEGGHIKMVLLFSVSIFVVSYLFFSSSIFFATFLRKGEKGALFGNLMFLFSFIMSMVYDMVDQGAWIKWISPLKYFEAKDIAAGNFDMVFLGFSLLLIIGVMGVSFWKFGEKDFVI